MDIKHSIACRGLIQGVGVNDADYIVTRKINGKREARIAQLESNLECVTNMASGMAERISSLEAKQ